MLNRVVITGRLTKDPELKVSQNNISIGNFTVAVNRPFTDANGERGADFINVVAFRKQAENVNQYLKKGSLAGVDGRLQSRTYDNKDGQRVFITEVVADSVQFLEPKSQNNLQGQTDQQPKNDSYTQAYGGQTQGKNTQQQEKQYEPNPFSNTDGPVDVGDDDLPF